MRGFFVACIVVFACSLVFADEESSEGKRLEDVLEAGAAKIEAAGFTLTFHGRVQTWAGWVGEDALRSNGDALEQPGFRLRRARFGVDGGFKDKVTFEIELDLFDQERTGGPLYRAYIGFKPIAYAGGRIGFMKFPFSYSEMRSSARLAHLDRSLGTYAMAPSSTMGAVVYGEPWLDHLVVTAGVFNGLQRRPAFHQGYEPVGVSEGNKFERLSYVARVDFEPLEKVGPDEADLSGSEHPRLALGGAFFYNDGKSVETIGASGYLHFKWFGTHLLGEVMWDRSSPQKTPTTSMNTVPTEISRLVASASVGYVWKRIGLAARVEYLDDNLDLHNEGDEIVFAGTLSYYALKNFLKAQLEYQHRYERFGLSLKNDSLLFGLQCAF